MKTLLLFLWMVVVVHAAERPNVILIMVDDMGRDWVSCYGARHPTPNIDRLAGQGVRYETAWCTPICTPTRVTLLTGHLILYVLHAPLDVEPVVANMLSTAINTTIVLAANRRWVWLIDSRVGIRSEIFPFMLIAAAGLVLSTALVWVTARSGGEGLWINAANLAGFHARSTNPM